MDPAHRTSTKEAESSEPEDHVAVEFEIMQQCIAKGEGASDAEEEQ